MKTNCNTCKHRSNLIFDSYFCAYRKDMRTVENCSLYEVKHNLFTKVLRSWRFK